MDESNLINIPGDLNRAIQTSEIPERLMAIGKRYGLTLEQIGNLEKIVMDVLHGNMHPRDFVGVVEEILGIEDDNLISVARDANLEIFLPVREALMNSDTPEKPQPTPETGSREEILAEIEDPKPSIQPITTSSQGDAVANAFIEGKLTETVRMPQQKATIELKNPEPPKKYSADPYREPTA